MITCSTNTVLNGPENPNFLGSNYFYFSLSRLPTFTHFVQSANLPMISTRVLNQPTTLGTYPKIPATNYYFDDLQVTFFVNADMENWRELYVWLRGIGNMIDDYTNLPYNPGDPNGVFSDATLLITNQNYSPVMEANFKYVFPKSLGGINFTSQNASTDPISCTVNFAYSYYTLCNIPGTGFCGPTCF